MPSKPPLRSLADLAALRAAAPPGPASPPPPAPKEPKLARVVVRRERKGHGGKTVTVLEGVEPRFRAAVLADLKKRLGTGAREDGETLVVMGDLVDRVADLLEIAGRHVVRGN